MSTSADITRMRRALTERYDAYGRQQALLRQRLDAILAVGRGDGVESDLAELIGRIADARAAMDVNFAVETQLLAAVEGALRSILERAR